MNQPIVEKWTRIHIQEQAYQNKAIMNQLNARISAKVDVFNPLLELFRARYPPDSISKIEPILKHFQALRNDLINPNILFGDIKLLEASIKKTREYLAMHAAIFRCVDPASFGAKLPWTDSISKVGTWSTDINGEKFSMLFNLGVTHHNLGKLLVETASKYKEAAKQYWTAAAVFTKIRQELMAIRLQDIGTDFSEPNLKLNMYTAKAMAQLCVIESTKADYENTARLFMARICQCAAELFELAYGSAMSSLVTGPLKEFLSEEFRNSLYFFFKLFQGLAAFYAARIYGDEGLVQDVQNSIGTAVGLLKVARAAFAECDKPRKVAPFVKSYYNRYKDFVKTKTEYIEKRNKEIYQEEMPMVLPKIEAVGIPKEVDMEEVFQTEFEGKMVLKLLVPTEILNLEKEYKNSVHKIKCGINAKEEEYKKEEEGFLSDRKLPQWVFEINDQKTNGEFPEQHTRNILKTHSKGGLEGLAKLHRQIKSEVGQWKIFMMHCPKNLEEEEKKYNEYKAKLKEEWTQVPSSDLNKDMKSEVEECLAKIKEGTENHEYYEKLLKSECEEKELLQLISKDIKEMQTEIPVSVVVTRIIAAPLAAQYAFNYSQQQQDNQSI
eukprot:TRINITY_DN224_c0_g3_i1.p2 TRINITY_DN224_c0_g3~~TRINITY_DN224_c0_g3_i1.p2  ORF type:complete len:608 (-),score=69.05 TRINITY_DN224_c0_g3_i1:11201-13024(-)